MVDDIASEAEVLAHAAGYAKALDDCDRGDVAALIKERDVLRVDLAIARAKLSVAERDRDELRARVATYPAALSSARSDGAREAPERAAPTPFNVNDHVRVRLLPKGRERLRERHELLMGKLLDKYPYQPPKEDADGWSEWQLWVLMSEFGNVVGNGLPPMFETTIEIVWPSALPTSPSEEA